MRRPAAFSAKCNEWTGLSGVYLLSSRGNIVYVGSSIDIPRRVSCHRSTKKYDRVFWIPVRQESLLRYESVLIRFFQPDYNSTHYCDYFGDDNSVLVELGLPSYADEAAVVRKYKQEFHEQRSAVMREARVERMADAELRKARNPSTEETP